MKGKIMVQINFYIFLFKEQINLLTFLLLFFFLTEELRAKNVFFLIILSIILGGISTFDTSIGQLLVCLSCVTIKYKDWHRNRQKRRQELSILLSLLLMNLIISILISALFVLVIGSFQNLMANLFAQIFMYVLLPNFILILISFTIVFSKKVTNIYRDLEDFGAFNFQLAFVDVFILTLVEITRLFKVERTFLIILTMVLIVQLIFSFYQTYIYYHKNKEREIISRTRNELSIMSTYTKQIENSYNDLRKFKHDYRNLLQSLDILLDSRNLNKAKEYLSKLSGYSDDLLKKSSYKYIAVTNLNNASLKSLIILKIVQAENSGIDNILFECEHPVVISPGIEIEVIRILGILIDNSIEAAIKSVDPVIKIIILAEKASIEFTIENTYEVEKINLKEIYNLNYSTKAGKHGVGLANVKEIVDTNNAFEIYNYVENDFFNTSFIVSEEEV